MLGMTIPSQDIRLARVMALGELTASLAHELRQPLAAIATNGEAGLRWLDRPEPAVDNVRASMVAMVGSAHRAEAIIRRLHTLSCKGVVERCELDLNGVITEVISLIEPRIRAKGICLRLILADERPSVAGDGVQLQQVMLNLMFNAIQAMASVSRRRHVLTVRTLLASDEACVTVSDTGKGLEGVAVDRLFDPFFTTRPEGVGLGLSICRSIVQAHGGRIRAFDNRGVGATFEFTVPLQGAR
jgi:two-component system sensor kinase FixL